MIIDKFPPIIDESMEIREKSLDEESEQEKVEKPWIDDLSELY